MGEMGFVVNLYDPCVAIRMVNVSQMIMCWHVDDLKVSHKDKFINTQFATWLGSIDEPKWTVKRGKVRFMTI